MPLTVSTVNGLNGKVVMRCHPEAAAVGDVLLAAAIQTHARQKT
jgi:hypothetical protein